MSTSLLEHVVLNRIFFDLVDIWQVTSHSTHENNNQKTTLKKVWNNLSFRKKTPLWQQETYWYFCGFHVELLLTVCHLPGEFLFLPTERITGAYFTHYLEGKTNFPLFIQKIKCCDGCCECTCIMVVIECHKEIQKKKTWTCMNHTYRKWALFFTPEWSIFLFGNELWLKHGGAHVKVMLLCQLAEFGRF